MAQVDRVAPFLGFIFGTPFLGPAFEAIFCFGACKPGLFFLPVGQLHPARIFWSTWMNVLWLRTWKGAEVLFCDLYAVQCEHL